MQFKCIGICIDNFYYISVIEVLMLCNSGYVKVYL